MFTLIELTRSDWNYVGLGLNILADCIFFGSLYWGTWRIKSLKEKEKENDGWFFGKRSNPGFGYFRRLSRLWLLAKEKDVKNHDHPFAAGGRNSFVLHDVC